MRNLYIFDCFGVIVSDVSTLFLNKHLDAEKQLYMRKVFRRVDVGEIQMPEMFAELAAVSNMTVDDVVAEWRGYEYVLTDTLKVVETLRGEGHCAVLLSNANVDYVDYLFDKFDLRKYFDRMFVSSSYRCAKPDEQFYKLCVDSFDERFGLICFTDDNPDNLVGVKRFGITPVLFVNACDFADKIKRL